MKKLFFILLATVLISFVASSCVSGGKMGCPNNVGSNKPFRA